MVRLCLEVIIVKVENFEQIGLRIRQARKQKNLTQEKLAENVSISPSYMTSIETGNRSASILILSAIADHLGLTVDYLLTGNEQNFDEALFKEWQQLTKGRSLSEIKSAYSIVQTFFTMLDEHKEKK